MAISATQVGQERKNHAKENEMGLHTSPRAVCITSHNRVEFLFKTDFHITEEDRGKAEGQDPSPGKES